MRLGRVLFALLAGTIVALVVYQSSVARVRDEESVDVVVAARDLPARTIVGADALRVDSVPRRLVSSGTVRAIADAERRVLRDPLFAGEIVNERHLAQRGADLSASLLIPSGKPYAFNLPISLFLSAPPRLQLHDRIDIVAYPRGKSLSEGGVIVSNLEIIDLSPRSSDNVSESQYLTVGASAEEIVRILASREGYVLGIALRPFERP
jgi:Flp pilus assembly protein CpaB